MCKYNSQRSLKKQRFGRRSAQCDLPILDILGVQDRARIGRKCFENSPEYCFYRLTISRCRIAIRFANRHLGSANRRRSIVASISAHSRAITRGGGGEGVIPLGRHAASSRRDDQRTDVVIPCCCTLWCASDAHNAAARRRDAEKQGREPIPLGIPRTWASSNEHSRDGRIPPFVSGVPGTFMDIAGRRSATLIP